MDLFFFFFILGPKKLLSHFILLVLVVPNLFPFLSVLRRPFLRSHGFCQLSPGARLMQLQRNHCGLRQQELLPRAGSRGGGAPEKCLLVFDPKYTCPCK